MRAVLQKVTHAAVTVDGETVGRIVGPGLLVLLGIQAGDTDADSAYIAGKIADVRLFAPPNDADGPEQSVAEIGGPVLVISQFTLLGDVRKGRRPSWAEAARPDDAQIGYEAVIAHLRARGLTVETGTFRAHMEVTLTNDGPITLLLDSRKAF